MTYEQVEELGNQAWLAIDEEDFVQANQIGQQLIDAGWENGYRIRSAAEESQENWSEAEQFLQDGINAFPEVWQLRLQLGTLYYLQGQFAEALVVYEQALTLPEVEIDLIKLNQAGALAQSSQVDEALNLLQSIEAEGYFNSAFDLQVRILDQVMRNDLILELAEEELEKLVQPRNEEEAEVLGRILSIVAAAAFYEEREKKEIRFYLEQAVGYDRSNELTMMITRELKAITVENAHLYGLLVQTVYKDESGETPVLSTYGVVADSEAEALTFIKEYDIPELDREKMKIVEVEINEAEEEDMDEETLKGIYFVGGLGFMEE